MTDNPQPVIISLYPSFDTPEAIEFYKWLGICITIWAYIDRHLYQIFHHATGIEQEQSARRFYKNRSFSGRLDLADCAVKKALTAKEYRRMDTNLRRGIGVVVYA